LKKKEKEIGFKCTSNTYIDLPKQIWEWKIKNYFPLDNIFKSEINGVFSRGRPSSLFSKSKNKNDPRSVFDKLIEKIQFVE
jgi:hypothetical protein